MAFRASSSLSSMPSPSSRAASLRRRRVPLVRAQEVDRTGPTRERVQQATALVERGKYKEAAKELSAVLKLELEEDEARTANYNLACALSRLRRFEDVEEPLVKAVNDYGVKYNVVLKDPDLRQFRASTYFDDVQSKLKGGTGSDEQYVKLLSESASPFRFFRLFAFGALDAGAAIGLIIITARLAAAVRGGEGAPDLRETLQNFAINVTAVATLTFLFVRDLKASRAKEAEVKVLEDLGKLPLDAGMNGEMPLSRLRLRNRILLLKGDASYVRSCLRACKPYQRGLQSAGFVVVPVTPESTLSRGGSRLSKAKGGFSSSPAERSSGGEGLGADASGEADDDGPEAEASSRFVLKPSDVPRWTAWLESYNEGTNLAYAENVYVQLQFDGTVRQTGSGEPPWRDYANLPPQKDIRSKIAG